MGLTCVAFAGMLFVARPRFLFPVAGDDSMDNTVGTLFALAGAFAGASVFVLVRRIGLGLVDWRTTLLYQSLGQTCLGLLWIPVSLASSSITTDHTAGHLTSRTWLVLALLGMVGLLSQVSMTMGMQVEKSGPASAMRMWDVVFAYIWQAIALPDDAISPLSIFGASLVMLSMVVIILQKASAGPKQAQASTASSSSSSAAAVVSINDSTPLVPLVAVTAPSYVQLAAVREAR
jgi:drug/metabolite transporter (DMT)-like permease